MLFNIRAHESDNVHQQNNAYHYDIDRMQSEYCMYRAEPIGFERLLSIHQMLCHPYGRHYLARIIRKTDRKR